MLGAAATFLASLGGLYFSAQTARQAAQAQASERFSRSVEQLGSESIAVRVGAVYAFGHLMRDSREDQQAIVEILSSFIHLQAEQQPPPPKKETRPAPVDILAALRVLDEQPRPLALTSGGTGPTVERSMFLDGVDLSGLELAGISMRSADMSGMKLTGANLRVTNLSDSLMYSADLSGADLSSADLAGVQFVGADLTGAKLVDADLRNTALTGADLTGADLSKADLRDGAADGLGWDEPVVDANLTGANLAGTTLYYTKLTDVDLTGADLTNVSFGPAVLNGVDLTGADLTGVTGLENATLTNITCSAQTKWPRGYTVSSSGSCRN